MGSYHYLYAGFPRAVSESCRSARATARCAPASPTRKCSSPASARTSQKGLAAEKRLVEFREELKTLERQFNDLKVVLPDKRDVADMLRRIQTLATQSSLVVKVFRPQAVVSKQLHQEWPMALELDGTYHDLARFFDHVSKVPRIINVGGIAHQEQGREGRRRDGTTITAQCTATTFVLLDKPARRPPASPARFSVLAPPRRARPRPHSKGGGGSHG